MYKNVNVTFIKTLGARLNMQCGEKYANRALRDSEFLSGMYCVWHVKYF